jgi:hypothetical protein
MLLCCSGQVADPEVMEVMEAMAEATPEQEEL